MEPVIPSWGWPSPWSNSEWPWHRPEHGRCFYDFSQEIQYLWVRKEREGFKVHWPRLKSVLRSMDVLWAGLNQKKEDMGLEALKPWEKKGMGFRREGETTHKVKYMNFTSHWDKWQVEPLSSAVPCIHLHFSLHCYCFKSMMKWSLERELPKTRRHLISSCSLEVLVDTCCLSRPLFVRKTSDSSRDWNGPTPLRLVDRVHFHKAS